MTRFESERDRESEREREVNKEMFFHGAALVFNDNNRFNRVIVRVVKKNEIQMTLANIIKLRCSYDI